MCVYVGVGRYQQYTHATQTHLLASLHGNTWPRTQGWRLHLTLQLGLLFLKVYLSAVTKISEINLKTQHSLNFSLYFLTLRKRNLEVGSTIHRFVIWRNGGSEKFSGSAESTLFWKQRKNLTVPGHFRVLLLRECAQREQRQEFIWNT